MRSELLEILVCPACKGELALTIDRQEETDILTGSLDCRACNETYPIKDSIPNMLPPELRKA